MTERIVSPETTALRIKVADAIKYAGGSITAHFIRKKLDLDTTATTKISQTLNYFTHKKWADKTGTNKGTKYIFNSNYNDELNPLRAGDDIDRAFATPAPLKPRSAALVPVASVEVPRCTLKLLVKNVMENNDPLEGELQRAVMSVLKKIL